MLVDHEWPMWGLESTVLPDWVLPSHTTRHPIFLNYLNWRYLPLKSCRDITMSLGTTRKIMFFCHKDTVMRLRLLKRSSWIKVSFSHSMRCICGNLSWGFPGAEKIHGKNSLQRSTKKKPLNRPTPVVARARVEKEDPCHHGNDAAVYDPQHKKRYDLWNIHRLLKLSTIERALQLRANQHFVWSDH